MRFSLGFLCQSTISPVEAAYIDSTSSDTDLTTYSATIGIGSNVPGSQIIFVAGARANAARTVSGVTCDGVAMTLVNTANNTSGGADICTMWRLDRSAIPDPTQTNADFSITFSNTMLRCLLATYQITGPVNATPFYNNTNTTLSSNALSLTDVDVPVKGCCIGFANANGINIETAWTGITEDFDSQPETTSDCWSGAHANFTPAQTNITVTATFSGGTPSYAAMVVATWGH